MKKWIYATDACEILKSNSSLVYRAAKEHGWEYKMGPSSKTGGPRRKLFLSSDVRWLKKELKRIGPKGHACGDNALSEVMELVKWADSLPGPGFPDMSEIKKRTTFKYRVPDIVSVIENRVARGLPGLKTV